MNEVFVLLITSHLFFGFLALFFSIKERNTKKRSIEQQRELSRKIYEVSVLNALQEEVGYSLNIRKVIETILSRLEDLFSFSTVSYGLVYDDRIIVKTYTKDLVNAEFLHSVQRIVLNAIYGIDEATRGLKLEMDVAGGVVNDVQNHPASYFNIPLVVQDKFLGVISVSSKYKNRYQETEMNILYGIVNQATGALEKLERVIETEQGKLRSMFASLPNGAIVFLFEDGLLRLSFINRAAKGFLHITHQPNAINIISSLGVALDLIKEISTMLKEKKKIAFNDLAIYERHFKISISPVFLFGSSHIIGVAITMDDITIEKQLDQIREDFTNMVVHELRSPLTTIRGAADLLLAGKLTKEEEDKMILFIQDASRNMLDDINGLLDAAKIESGKFSIIRELNDMSLLAKNKVEQFRYVAENKGIDIAISVEGEIPQFEFDRERIGQVFNNLLSNSIKFTEKGGRIEVKVEKRGGDIQVQVSDTGIGIPKEKQEQLFSKYSQASKAMRKGTGLGLYISKGIVESHGGGIWLESQEEKGTTIFFTIPIMSPASPSVSRGQLHVPDEKVLLQARVVN